MVYKSNLLHFQSVKLQMFLVNFFLESQMTHSHSHVLMAEILFWSVTYLIPVPLQVLF